MAALGLYTVYIVEPCKRYIGCIWGLGFSECTIIQGFRLLRPVVLGD